MTRGPFGGPRPFAKKNPVPAEIEYNYSVDQDRVTELWGVLKQYPALRRTSYSSGHTNEDRVMLTYSLDKPLSEIELYSLSDERLRQFEEDMEEFFFTYERDNTVYVSRFKTLIEVVRDQGGLSDVNMDLSGLMYGFSPHNIAGHIERMSAYSNLLKK